MAMTRLLAVLLVTTLVALPVQGVTHCDPCKEEEAALGDDWAEKMITACVADPAKATKVQSCAVTHTDEMDMVICIISKCSTECIPNFQVERPTNSVVCADNLLPWLLSIYCLSLWMSYKNCRRWPIVSGTTTETPAAQRKMLVALRKNCRNLRLPWGAARANP